MLILVTGGSGSGKSEFAENLAVSLGGRLTYIAAMKPYGGGAEERIARHRKMRAGKGFETVERYTGIKNLSVSGTAVLECVSNLLANEMFDAGEPDAEKEIIEGINSLSVQCANLIIVTNEVSSDGLDYGEETREYMKKLGIINRVAAKKADRVYEAVCGAAIRIK